MAYGFNDGDQRRQSVRLAGRATPTPGSSSSSTAASPQYPSSSQRQPRPTPRQNTSGSETRGQASTAATRRRDGAVASSRSNAKTERRSRSTDQRQSTRSFTGTRQRQTDVPQLRRNGRPPARHLCPPFFFAPAERTQRPELSPGISSRLRRSRSTLPPRTHRALLHRRVPALFIFRLVYLPRISRSRAHRRGQAAQGPRRARLFFRLFDPALAMASRHDAPYLSDRPCMVGAALRRRYHPPKCLRAYVPHHGLYL